MPHAENRFPDEQTNKRDLTSGTISFQMARLASPMVLGIIAVMSISLVDTYFVSQLGMKPLAALAFTFPVTFTLTNIAIGLSAGTSSVVSRALGLDNKAKARRLSTDSLILSFLTVLAITCLGILTIDPLFTLLGASGETLDLINRYMTIWYFSIPLVIIPMVSNGIIRASGDSFWPSVMMGLSAGLNVLMTPLFIFGWEFIPAMDIEGAAIATLFARAISFFFALYIVIIREKLVTLAFEGMAALAQSWREITKIAIPAAMGNMSNPIAIGVATALLAKFGEETVAAFGVATRIEAFATIPLLAMSAATSPLVGQNWGAGKIDRVTTTQKLSYTTSAIWSVFLGIVFIIGGRFIGQLFDVTDEGLDEIHLYLSIVGSSLFGYGVAICGASCFNAAGKPLIGLFHYTLRSIALYIPFSALASVFFDQAMAVYISIAAANAIAGVSLWFYTFYKIDKLKNC